MYGYGYKYTSGLVIGSGGAPVDTTFKMTVDTTQAGSGSTVFVLPLSSIAPPNMTVYWGDGNSDLITTWNDPALSHDYGIGNGGTYQITLDGDFYQILFVNSGDKLKVSSIDNWGTNVWGNFNNPFHGCSNLIGTYTDNPDTSNCVQFTQAFKGCTNFNSPLSFDTSIATNLYAVFNGCTNFNSSVTYSDTSNVIDMRNMFYNCGAFNQDVNFDTSSVLYINDIFYGCTNFNKPVNFNTASVTNTTRMFMLCSSFNQTINFDFTSCTGTTLMFYQCTSFNSPVTFTNGSGVATFSNLFNGCTIFNQDISAFDITSITNAINMLAGTAFSTANYDLLLPLWDAYGTSNVTFHAGAAQYNAGAPATAHANMLGRGWSITDSGQV